MKLTSNLSSFRQYDPLAICVIRRHVIVQGDIASKCSYPAIRFGGQDIRPPTPTSRPLMAHIATCPDCRADAVYGAGAPTGGAVTHRSALSQQHQLSGN